MSHKILDWMPWYGTLFWGSVRVLRLSENACNLYRWMLDYQWIHGNVPDDAVVVSRLYPWGQTALDSWREVRPLFDVKDGGLVNPKLAAVHADQSERAEAGKVQRAEAGRRSALARAQKYGSSAPAMNDRSKDRSATVRTDSVNDRTTDRNGSERIGEEREKSSRAPRVLPTGDHAEAIRFFEAQFLAATGKPYAFEGAKDGDAVKTLLKRGGLPEFQARAVAFFRDPWHRDHGLTLSKFRTAWNALVIAQPVHVQQVPRQPSRAAEVRAERAARRAQLEAQKGNIA